MRCPGLIRFLVVTLLLGASSCMFRTPPPGTTVHESLRGVAMHGDPESPRFLVIVYVWKFWQDQSSFNGGRFVMVSETARAFFCDAAMNTVTPICELPIPYDVDGFVFEAGVNCQIAGWDKDGAYVAMSSQPRGKAWGAFEPYEWFRISAAGACQTIAEPPSFREALNRTPRDTFEQRGNRFPFPAVPELSLIRHGWTIRLESADRVAAEFRINPETYVVEPGTLGPEAFAATIESLKSVR